MYDAGKKQDNFEDFMRQIDDAIAGGEPPGDSNPYRRQQAPSLDHFFDEDFDENFEDDFIEDELEEGPPQPVIRAYNGDFSDERPRNTPRRTQPPMENTQKYQAMETEIRRRQQAPKPQKTRRPKRKRRGHGCLVSLFLLAALIIGGVFWFRSVVKPPQGGSSLGRRKPGCTTVLLAGTDADGGRTDTMILLYLDRNNKKANLVSLPRDTYTITPAGNVAKLNSAYGRNGKGEEGMEGLLDYVEDIVGYRPDGYMLLDLEGFVSLVDVMGGVNFDVPMDMFYEDASQDLYIDLKEGMQKLNGKDAMGLVRFRSGYAMADLERVNVQREFLSACMEQWLSLKNAVKLPSALSTLTKATTDNLSTGNLIWMGLAGWHIGVGNIESITLPGRAEDRSGGSYYVLDAERVADTVNEYCNPYEKDVDVSDLNIAG